MSERNGHWWSRRRRLGARVDHVTSLHAWHACEEDERTLRSRPSRTATNGDSRRDSICLPSLHYSQLTAQPSCSAARNIQMGKKGRRHPLWFPPLFLSPLQLLLPHSSLAFPDGYPHTRRLHHWSIGGDISITYGRPVYSDNLCR